MAKSAKRSKAMKKVALKRLHRTKATGNFKKIEEKAAKEYGSVEAGKKVAGSQYWKLVKKKRGK
jgi:hypothetical protein